VVFEIEHKFWADDHAAVRARLANATPAYERDEADHYFAAPDRDYAQTDEAFRLRVSGPEAVLTYKGPKRPGEVKTRTEIELPLALGCDADAVRLLLALRYSPVAVVRKRREALTLSRDGFEVTVCLDDVERVGRFVEIEILCEEVNLEAAQNVVQTLAAELGLKDVERRSYLRMLLAKEAKA
jgi:adenylate cyclase, class 2